MTKRGKFITLEGADGSGKTTLARRIADALANVGIHCIRTREPGGPPISEAIRRILLDPAHTELSSRTEALLYAASRAQHVSETIRPALESGQHVLCERYVLSSIAYQGFGRGLGEAAVRGINDFAVDGLYPDLTLFFSVHPDETLRRKQGDPDRLETLGNAFHADVYEGYRKALKQYPGEVVVIDAAQDEDAVFEATWPVVLRYLKGSETK